MELTVYSAFSCPDCREAKRHLPATIFRCTRSGHEKNPGAAAEVFAHTGQRSVPQFVVDGHWVSTLPPRRRIPVSEEMSKLLGMKNPDNPSYIAFRTLGTPRLAGEDRGSSVGRPAA